MKAETRGNRKRSENHVLVALLGGVRVGDVYRAQSGGLRFVYLEEWRRSKSAYPLSLSMPLTAQEHRDDAISSFLWGLLPDNQRALDHYGRLFGVSPRNPAAILAHIGADCAGAVQFAAPDSAKRLEGLAESGGNIEWLTEGEIGRELKTVREQGIPGTSRRTVGQFSLAGAQPKMALIEADGRWGRPTGRIPTNRILKPPSGQFRGFAENEHFCLELAAGLELGSVVSRIVTFAGEITIVVERYDREFRNGVWRRIHQEDLCQALGFMPAQKYENEGGPGCKEILGLLQDASLRPNEDVERFIRVTALNWVIAATDAHAKNYALLHSPDGVRLAPFYDILSYLPYADARLHRVKMAMKIGGEYLARRINRYRWSEFARQSRMDEKIVLANVQQVLDGLPEAIDRTAENSVREGLDPTVVDGIAKQIRKRVGECRELVQ